MSEQPENLRVYANLVIGLLRNGENDLHLITIKELRRNNDTIIISIPDEQKVYFEEIERALKLKQNNGDFLKKTS